MVKLCNLGNLASLIDKVYIAIKQFTMLTCSKVFAVNSEFKSATQPAVRSLPSTVLNRPVYLSPYFRVCCSGLGSITLVSSV